MSVADPSESTVNMSNFLMVVARSLPVLIRPDVGTSLCDITSPHPNSQAGRPVILIDGPFGDYETLVKEGHKTVDFYVNGEVGHIT